MQKFSFLIFFFFFLSCSMEEKSQLPPFKTVVSSIIGGQKVVSPEYHSVVAITYKGKVLCSGSLIDSQYILTAAHCILPVELPQQFKSMEEFILETKIYIGTGEEEGLFKGQYEIANIFTHPAYRNHYRGKNDLALIELKKPILFLKPLALLTSVSDLKAALQVGKQVEIIGFGHRKNVFGQLGDIEKKVGVKYKTQMPLVEVYANEIVLNKSGKGACQGDSGGPALVHIDNQAYLIGAASRVKGKCAGEESLTYYSLIPDSLCWVKSKTGVSIGDFEFICSQQIFSQDDQSFLDACLMAQGKTRLTVEALFRNLNVTSCRQLDLIRKKVQQLNLSNEFLVDVKLLKFFSSLTKLDLSDNQIQDISALTKTHSFAELDITGNNISLAQISEIKANKLIGRKKQKHNHFKTHFFQACMNYENEPVSTQEVIDEVRLIQGKEDCLQLHIGLKSMTSLNLSGMGLENLNLIKEYHEFTLLYLDYNNLKDLSGLSQMSKLESLYISNNKLESLDGIETLEKLNYIDVSENQIVDFNSLYNVKNYLNITLYGNLDKSPKVCQQLPMIDCF
jgi:secreted trypsin-like serine protease